MATAVQCDGMKVTHNTVARMLHGALTVAFSADVTVEHNSINFAGNYAFSPIMTKEQFASFHSDYNNFATFIPKHWWTDELAEEERIERQQYGSASKALGSLSIPMDGFFPIRIACQSMFVYAGQFHLGFAVSGPGRPGEPLQGSGQRRGGAHALFKHQSQVELGIVITHVGGFFKNPAGQRVIVCRLSQMAVVLEF